MSAVTQEVKDAILIAVECVLEAAAVAGPMGAPSGIVYAALMAHGMRLETYQSLLGVLERAGKISVRGHCIHLVETAVPNV